MITTTEPQEIVFIDIVPQSLYGSLIEIRVRIQSKKYSGKYQFSIPHNYKIVSVLSETPVNFFQNQKHNEVSITYKDYSNNCVFEIGRIDNEHFSGRGCDDSGWDLYPLMSNELILPLRVSQYSNLTIKVIFPENCHGYSNKKFSYISISII